MQHFLTNMLKSYLAESLLGGLITSSQTRTLILLQKIFSLIHRHQLYYSTGIHMSHVNVIMVGRPLWLRQLFVSRSN